jgi:hypothetical protein
MRAAARCVARTLVLGLIGAALAAVAADPAPRLDAGNWRVRVTSVTNGVADPNQDEQVCLRDELKDLAAYFAPQLEGVKASCTTTRVPVADRKVLARRLRCVGAGFTYEAESRVRIVSPSRFTLTLDSVAKTAKETGVVSAKGEGDHLGPCKSASP